MNKPLLQVALDHLSLAEALKTTRVIADEVDVLEGGTILCYAEGGPRVVETLRALYPEKIILADLKAADAGTVVAKQVFEKGATWMTVICSAPYATMAAAKKVADEHGGDIQVELYGDWTFEHAAQWLKLGLTQAIYHRGRDAELAGQKWGEADLNKIKKMAEMGFDISVTGGLNPEDLEYFKGIPVKCFIAGRSLSGAPDPVAVSRAFKAEIDRLW